MRRRGSCATLSGGEVQDGVYAVDRSLDQGERGVARDLDRVDVVLQVGAAYRLPANTPDGLGDLGKQVFDLLGFHDLEDLL